MDRIKYDSTYVSIDLKRCIHRFNPEAAIGKSAFARIAREDKSCGITVFSLDRMEDYLKIDTYLNFNPENTIWVLDRFDMFASDYITSLLSRHQEKCILIDCKRNWCYTVPYITADVKLTEKGIIVYDNAK